MHFPSNLFVSTITQNKRGPEKLGDWLEVTQTRLEPRLDLGFEARLTTFPINTKLHRNKNSFPLLGTCRVLGIYWIDVGVSKGNLHHTGTHFPRAFLFLIMPSLPLACASNRTAPSTKILSALSHKLPDRSPLSFSSHPPFSKYHRQVQILRIILVFSISFNSPPSAPQQVLLVPSTKWI